MDYESFKEQFVEEVKDRLYEQGAEVNVSVHEVNKLNESYEAITVTPEGSNIGVNVGIDKFYDAMENGRSYDEVVDKAVDVVTNGITQRPDFDINSLSDYSQMKEKLAMEVVSAEANKEMLETVPHQNIEDMAVVYRLVLNSDDEGRASILLTNQLIESMGVTPEQLHADAMENAPQIKPVEIKGMSEVMAEMMGLFPVAPEDEKIYVATVPDKVHGAGVLAYQNFMDQAAERAGGDFFILPSSIHEILIVPDNGEIRSNPIPTMKSIGGVKDENGVSSKPSEEVKAEPEKIDFSNVKIEPLFEEEVDFDTFSKSDFRAVKVKECVAVPKSKKLLQFTLDDGTGKDRTILSGIHAYYEPEELVGKTLIAITNLPPRKMMGIESCGMLLSAVNNLKDSEDEELHLLMVDNHIPAGAKLY